MEAAGRAPEVSYPELEGSALIEMCHAFFPLWVADMGAFLAGAGVAKDLSGHFDALARVCLGRAEIMRGCADAPVSAHRASSWPPARHGGDCPGPPLEANAALHGLAAAPPQLHCQLGGSRQAIRGQDSGGAPSAT